MTKTRHVKSAVVSVIGAAVFALSSGFVLSACGKTDEDVNIAFTKNGVDVTWASVEGADEYRVYHSPSRFGKYELVQTSGKRKYSDTDKYGYYRVDAVAGDSVLSSELYSYDLQTFGPNVHVYAPTDDHAAIQADYDAFRDSTGQFSELRYAGLFKVGEYNDLNLKMRYYMTVAGLGDLPADVELGGFYTKGELSGGNSTCNFWCGVENLSVNSDVQWAVSQATSFRRMKVNGNLTLHDTGSTPWASGGFISDTVVTGTIDGSVQQQWLTRNSVYNTWSGCDINMVFSGCEGKFADKSYAWPSKRVTEFESTNVMREKPYITFSNEYYVCVPHIRKETKGASWDSEEDNFENYADYIPLSRFYVARADKDNATTLNAQLKNGKNIVFTPGIYQIDEPLQVTYADTLLVGMGLASLKLGDKNKDAIMRVADVDGVSISGLMFDAGAQSKTLLELGATKTGASHKDNPTVLNDVYFRIGGAGSEATSVDCALLINSNNVVGDNFWVWRADHGNRGTVGWDINKATNGVIVNGDDVTVYGLMVEHFQKYQTIWNGENGFVAFYQSETPYDAPEWGDYDENGEFIGFSGNKTWLSEWNGKTYDGYASYKVADHVKKHTAYGIGVYYVGRALFDLDHAIELPSNEGISVIHMAIANFATQGDKATYGGIRHIVNDRGESLYNGNKKNQYTSFIAGEYIE